MLENKDQEETTPVIIPAGIKIRHTLSGDQNIINRISWSPDGSLLAMPTHDSTILLWKADTGKLYKTFSKAPGLAIGATNTITWSPGGWTLASASQHGLLLHNSGEGYGELTLFFSEPTSKELRAYFEGYVKTHLERRSLPDSLEERRIFICYKCNTPFTDTQIKRRRELGFDQIRCNVCDTMISLLDQEEELRKNNSSIVSGMDLTADANRERDTASARQLASMAQHLTEIINIEISFSSLILY